MNVMPAVVADIARTPSLSGPGEREDRHKPRRTRGDGGLVAQLPIRAKPMLANQAGSGEDEQ